MNKIVLSVFILLLCISYIFASGWHTADEIVSGNFSGDYKFVNSIKVNSLIDEDVGTIRDNDGGWVRTYGQTGWYSETYGGGWYMFDSTWIRAVNDKNIYTGGIIQSGHSIKAPILYDLNNAGYYSDPSATSNLNRVLVGYYPTSPNDVAIKSYVDAKAGGQGDICGFATNGCGWVGSIKCRGIDPGCGSCPAGYEIRDWTGPFGSTGHLLFCARIS